MRHEHRTRLTLGSLRALAGAGLVLSSAIVGVPATGNAVGAAGKSIAAPDAVELRPFWARRLTGYLKTRDGQDLHYSVLLPAGRGPFPTLVVYSGYSPGSIGGAGYLAGHVNYPRDIEKQLLGAGYAIFGVNARSTGCSTGDSFDWLRPLYGQDGYDAVEFAASQPWSTGSVGMYSWSWAGMSQLWTASFRPPHLKAIAPGLVIADPRADSYAPGGVPQPSMISEWGALYIPEQWRGVRETAEAEHDTRCLEQLERNLKLLDAGSPGRLVLQHPLNDDFLEQRAVARRTHLINVPVLSMTAFQDWDTTSRGGYYQESVDPKLLWMIDTNGDHGMYASLEFRKALVRFFDHFVKGRQNGFETTARLQVWQEAGGAWNQPANPEEEELEAARQRSATPNFIVERPTIRPPVTSISFALAHDGQLLEGGTASGPEQGFMYPSPGASVGRDDWGSQPTGWKEGSLVFTSQPFGRDLVTYGAASVDLWISSKVASDADLQVTVTAVLPGGEEMYVQRGWLRLSNRAFDVARSTASRPVRNNMASDLAPLPADTPVLARVEINRFSYAFRKGSRLRIWIEAPSNTGDYSFSYDPVSSPLVLWHDPAHPSRVVLDVLKDEAIPRPARRCGELIGQPCRPDPVAVIAAP